MLNSPQKKYDTVPHPRVASAKPTWWETTHVQKCMYMQDVLCSVTERIIKFKLLQGELYN
jgi:hypothetical protein